MTDPTAPDLSLVTADELIGELSRRFDGLVVLRELDKVPGRTGLGMEYFGGLSRCMGMAHRGLLMMEDTARPGPGDVNE